MRLRNRLPTLSLVAGWVALVVTTPVLVASGAASAMKEFPWLAGMAVFLGAATIVWRRLPGQPVAWWFAVAGGLAAVIQGTQGLLVLPGVAGDHATLAWAVLAFNLAMVLGGVAIVHLIGLFPDAADVRPGERRALRALWGLLALPVLAFLGADALVMPAYLLQPDVANPYQLAPLAAVGGVAGAGVAVLQGVFAFGAVLLAMRYRRAPTARRRRMRWLLLPAVFTAFIAAFDLVAWRLTPEQTAVLAWQILLSGLWVLAIASLPLALAVGLLRPDLLDVDRVIRKSLVYALLWLLIAAAYVAAAAGLGVAAGQRFSVGVAIALAVVAAVVFQPARQRLERLADRWVFGVRADPARLVSRLGVALEETVELERLLPRMADTLQEGLGLRWARVRLQPAPAVGDEEPALSVPIVLDGERLGVVECGPKQTGALTADDEAVVATLARQAALAVRNVRLTAELQHSRARLVRAQDAERRRLERNIHDGVQQDLVALIGHTALVRRQLSEDPSQGERSLVELTEGLRRVIGELRELAQGIHPSVLSDRGLLEAVEALASRSAIPVSVRADPDLRGTRFANEVEGAGYFTVAEALANVGKHATATHAEVSLRHDPEALRIDVRDDGAGFDPAAVSGDGLANLAERLAALGGRLDVASSPGGGTTVSAWLRVGA